MKIVASAPVSTELKIVKVDNNQQMETSNGVLDIGRTNYLLAIGTNIRKSGMFLRCLDQGRQRTKYFGCNEA